MFVCCQVKSHWWKFKCIARFLNVPEDSCRSKVICFLVWAAHKNFAVLVIMKEKSYFYCQSFFIFTVRYYTLLPRYKIFASYLSGPWSLIFLYFILYSMVVEEQLWSPQSPSFSHPALCTSLTLWLRKCEVFQRWHHWQPSSFSSELSGFDEDITAEEIVDIWKLIQDSLY